MLEQLTPRTLREYINEVVLNDLLEHGQDVLKAISNTSPNDEHRGRDLVDILRSYRARPILKDGSRNIKYEYATGRADGRLMSKGGVTIQDMDRPVRHALCADKLCDLDLVNAHPMLYCQLLLNLKRECPQLTNYVNNREIILKSVMEQYGVSRDEAKHLMLRILYGGAAKIGKRKVNHGFVLALRGEMREHHKFISKQYPDTFQFCIDKGRDYPESSCASMVLGAIENGILKVLFETATEMKMEPSVLCYDGLMCRSVHKEFVHKAVAAIKERTGYVVAVEEKPMEPYNLDAMRAKYHWSDSDAETDEECESEPKQQKLSSWPTDREYLRRVCDGELGLARELKALRGMSLKNVAGDDSDAVFYRFNETDTLWELVERTDVMVEEIEHVRKALEDMMARYDGFLVGLLKEKAKSAKRGFEFKGHDDLRILLAANNTIGTMKNVKKLTAVMKLACNTLRDVEFKESINWNKELLSVKNGVIDLRTGELRARRREDYITYAVNLVYDPNHPKLKNVEEIMKQITLAEKLDRADYLDFMQQLLGYAITGYDREQILIFCIGNGANGKGLLETMVRKITGPVLFYSAPPDVIKASRHGANTGAACSHIMALKGRRVAWVDEYPEGRLDRQLATTLCGGAPIVGRMLYGNVEEFLPSHTMFVNTNHLPGMDNDPALLRRIVALPFDAEFRTVDHSDPEMRLDEKNPKHFLRDNDLADKIPYEAFLTWVVQGAVKYLAANKLPDKPDCCAVKSAEVKEDNDRLQDFIEEQCLVGEQYQIPCYIFLEKFRKWRGFSGIRKKDVHQAMEKKGYKLFKDRALHSVDENKMVYSNIDLNERNVPTATRSPGKWRG